MEATDDLDFTGYWTSDDNEALLGLAAYRYLAARLGDRSQATWATLEYGALLAATDQTLQVTMARFGLGYLPCSLVQPNNDNTCALPEDANWSSPLGRWAWDAFLLGAPVTGPGATLIDATYAHGFGRLRGRLPPGTFGGFPDDYYSSAYNAGDGMAGLATDGPFRDQGILGYQFMVRHGQSGPWSWWESSGAPAPGIPWAGQHPATGQGSSPHAWGIAQANNVLLDVAGGAASRRHHPGRPGRAHRVAGPRFVALGHQLPRPRWAPDRGDAHLHRPGGHLAPHRPAGAGARATRAPGLGGGDRRHLLGLRVPGAGSARARHPLHHRAAAPPGAAAP